MNRPRNGTAVFYHRDSGGKAEVAPGQYVDWARRESERLQLRFDGTARDIDEMIRDRVSNKGLIYLDYDVAGHLMSRPGLDALIARIKSDVSISHVIIPRRDRLARPSNPIDGAMLELSIRQAGLYLVYTDKILQPLPPGMYQDIGELLTTIVEFDQAGKDRRQLAEKIILAQLRLARDGYSTGGRPPYGFRRWLYSDNGQAVRELVDGERVKLRGHHVVWRPLPDDHPHMATIRRILEELPKMPASRLAAMLTSEGVQTPDWGRIRHDRGKAHRTRGVWNVSTINNIGRNKLLSAICSYGRRSMGDQKRFDVNGPRALKSEDWLSPTKPKVIRNAVVIESASKVFDPIIEPSQQSDLIRILDRRGGTQRGKPRSSTPELNPLGGRVFDIACGSPLYRSGEFKYRCGLYMQSHGAACNHNAVDGATATRFVLEFLRKRLLGLRFRQRLRNRLVELAAPATPSSANDAGLRRLRSDLTRIEAEIETAEGNLALAKNPNQFAAVGRVLDKLKFQETEVRRQLAEIEPAPAMLYDADAEVEAAMGMFDRLEELSDTPDDLAAIGRAFGLVNLRIFFRFEKRQWKKRVLDKVSGGVVTFGDAPPPVQLYSGPTGRKALKEALAASTAADPVGDGPRPDVLASGEEGSLLGNLSRGDRI
jgi:hypothetical protein